MVITCKITPKWRDNILCNNKMIYNVIQNGTFQMHILNEKLKDMYVKYRRIDMAI